MAAPTIHFSKEAPNKGSSSLSQSLDSASSQRVLDFESFRRQESTFVLLNMFVLAILLLIHTLFASHWGEPSQALIAILAGAFVVQGAELVWLQTRAQPLGPRGIALLSWSLICLNILLALVLAEVTSRPDTQYFILLVVPVLVAAFRMALLPTLGVIVLVDFINFFWVWYYSRQHPHADVDEYFEAMTVSLIYAVVGLVVWLLVYSLRQKETKLSQSLVDLERARERVLHEGKLAAVGRLASAIAHEIRNPVAAIVSALSTAERDGLKTAERDEMFDIAAKEANRLEKLTTDFLTYARPCGPRRIVCVVDDTLGYVAEVCRPRASEKGVKIDPGVPGRLVAEIDAGQVQQALINVVMNAVDASASGAHIGLRAVADSGGGIRIDVANEGGAIPPEIVEHMFEPFFTTKQSGTGLGLAIARNIARAHGGDLVLLTNEPDRVCFCLTLPAGASNSTKSPEVRWAGS